MSKVIPQTEFCVSLQMYQIMLAQDVVSFSPVKYCFCVHGEDGLNLLLRSV